MWEPIVVNGVNYLLRFILNSEIKLFITNLTNIWIEELSQEDLVNRFQELNPLFDTTELATNELVERVMVMVKDIGNTTITLMEADNLILDLKFKILESSVKFHFKLMRRNDNTYFNEFVLPMIQSVQYLEMRQKKLFQILEKKDKEIEEYELEKGTITRSKYLTCLYYLFTSINLETLITNKFDRNNWMNDDPESLLVNVFGKSKEFYDIFSQKFGVIKFNSPIKDEKEPLKKKLKTSKEEVHF
ncbi:hypothetical protein FQA39_LY09725 [Lamprigera yunnana]|nr:hypothetical protein FQA39_LY09725 [Lamprigera yunnana]